MTLTDAQIAEIRAMEDSAGRLTPGQVVEAAKSKTSPLHELFEWDKSKAAYAQWLQTAREVIGSVRIVVTTTTTIVKSPIYVRDPDAVGQGYRSTMGLRQDPAAARQSLIYTLEVASGHVRRAFDLAEPLGLSAEVDDLIERIVGLQRVVRAEAA